MPNPPAQNKYDTLRQKLQERFTESEERRLQKLEMRELGPQLNEDILKTLWLQRLRPHVQAILSNTPGDMAHVIITADKIQEVFDMRGVHEISHVKPAADNAALNARTEFDEMHNQMAEMKLQIAAATRASRQHQRGRSPNRSSNSNRRRSISRVRDYCWYHNCFGDKANKCIKPCTFTQEK